MRHLLLLLLLFLSGCACGPLRDGVSKASPALDKVVVNYAVLVKYVEPRADLDPALQEAAAKLLAETGTDLEAAAAALRAALELSRE